MGEVVEPTFRSSVTRLVGDDARAWLAELPALEAELSGRWRLSLGPHLPGGLLASVRAVWRADGTDAVLKLAGPWDRAADEIACLRRWAGGPAPELLDADESRGAILLERIAPGTTASEADPDQVASLLQQIQLPDEIGLRPLDDAVVADSTAPPARAGRRGGGWRGPSPRWSGCGRRRRCA